VAHADQSRQAHRATINQRHTKASAEDTEIGILFHHAHVAPQGQLHAPGHRGAADGGNDGLGQYETRRSHGSCRALRCARDTIVRDRKIQRCEGIRSTIELLRHACTGLQIPPGTKVAMGTMEHRDAGVGICFKRHEGRIQLSGSVCVNGVAHIGTLQSNEGDIASH